MRKTFAGLAAAAAGLQLLRIGFKAWVFSFTDRTLLLDTAASCLYMLAVTGLLAAAARREKGAWTVFPAAFTRKYQLGTAAVLGFFLVTLGVTGVDTPARLLSLVYNAVVTVVFEELLFRGFFYRVLSREKNEKAALFLSALLFGLWHLGYADTVLWRAALFFPGTDVPQVLLGKAVTGCAIGVLLGLLRYRCKNVYAAMLAHSLLNTWGS
ncbi:MAG TPA: CPBP family intramembrane metalloprotease [Candidatus Faecalibacterium gallistercoris]|uniref:CPBP family intramembrane metalloprotease n=1 Tax=Candidatus Faecalibacterium gallistercoris TaxID=2838579 RepID=A0A9D2JLS1_9FIRM|nr:CPBP family intramembrane metalloprotease [Candidatus Faecalibacterium gallistercoris]